MSEIFM